MYTVHSNGSVSRIKAHKRNGIHCLVETIKSFHLGCCRVVMPKSGMSSMVLALVDGLVKDE